MSILCARVEERDEPASASLSIEELFAELLLTYAEAEVKKGAQGHGSRAETQNHGCACGCEWHRPSRKLVRRAGVHCGKNDSDVRSRPIEEKKATHRVDATAAVIDGTETDTATETATATTSVVILR